MIEMHKYIYGLAIEYFMPSQILFALIKESVPWFLFPTHVKHWRMLYASVSTEYAYWYVFYFEFLLLLMEANSVGIIIWISVLTSNTLASDPVYRTQKIPLSIFKDTTSIDTMPGHQSGKSKIDLSPWSTLGAREERDKENSALPTKWTTYKVASSLKNTPYNFSSEFLFNRRALNFEKMPSLRFLGDLELELEG